MKQAQTLDKIVNVRKKLKPLELSFSVKKIEMTLEGEPLENKASTPKISNAYRRTYLVRLSRIQLNKLGGYHESTSRLSVNDAFIVQMKDSKAEGNVRVIYPSTEPKHQILFELLEISTTKMERRVHDQGRSARKRGNYIRSKNQLMKKKNRIELTDSSLLLKVTFHLFGPASDMDVKAWVLVILGLRLVLALV